MCRPQRPLSWPVPGPRWPRQTLFKNIEQPFEATRYHSLLVERATLPECFEVSAWTSEQEIMGLRHREYLVEGIQFHPESILTRVGKSILQNFLDRCSNQ